MHRTTDEEFRKLDSRYIENRDWRFSVRGRGFRCSAEGSTVRSRKMPAVAHRRVDELRDVAMFQLENWSVLSTNKPHVCTDKL